MTNDQSVHSITALKRWSCQDAQLPPVSQIQNIHIYDFDNTIFQTALPNKQVWAGGTCGQLQGQDFIFNGGWWHNSDVLSAAGKGIDIEEPRAWEGLWNDNIVELARLSIADPATVTILLTGRGEKNFTDLIGRMLKSKSLSFDIVALKPSIGPAGQTFSSTLAFKEIILRDIITTYALANEIRLYEDRIKHVKSFRDFFSDLNQSLRSTNNHARPPFLAEVIQVSGEEYPLDPVTEVASVQQMINYHNQAVLDGTAPSHFVPLKIKRSVFYSGYLISDEDSKKLRSFVRIPDTCPEHEIRYLANNVLITPRPMPQSILAKVGGIGAKMSWRVTGVGLYEQRLWAVRVEPTLPGAQIYTENHTPCVVLATRRQTKPVDVNNISDWEPVGTDRAFSFDTVVGEKALLRIEEEFRHEDEYESKFPNARNTRRHPQEEDFPPLGSNNVPRGGYRQYPRTSNGAARGAWREKGRGQPYQTSNRGGGGNTSRGSYRGGNPSGGSRGRRGGRGNNRGAPRGSYKSLDDSSGQTYNGGGMQY